MSTALLAPELEPARPRRRRHQARARLVTAAPAKHRSTKPYALDWDVVIANALCRALNFSVALVALVFVSPVMLLIALLIKLTSPGPVFYNQPRVGINRRARGPRLTDRDLGGRPFTIFKFRTMRTDADAAGQVWASAHDPRITPIGRILRGFRLDELPQFLNVLLGDMSIVGPRPEQPRIAKDLRRKIAGYADRLAVPPGITGLAQVTLAYDQSLEDVKRKVELDLQYVQKRSPLLDLRIMLQTPKVMLLRKGAC